jgi:hypothetical protein
VSWEKQPAAEILSDLREGSAAKIPLKREQQLVWAFDFVLGFQKFFAPLFASALGALVDRAANRVTVIAGSFRAGAGELLTCLARLEELAFQRSVLFP